MNWMADKRVTLMGWLGAGLSLTAGLAVAGEREPASPAELHQALNLLQDGRAAEAETAAAETNVPRRWLVVAAARRQQQQFGRAAEAYKAFLQAAGQDPMAEHARQQLQWCARQGRAALPTAAAPSARITPQQREQLAVVDDKVHVETSDRFVVRARNVQLARLVVKEAELALQRVCNDILNGQTFKHSVDVYVWKDRQEYLANASDAPDWSGGAFSVKEKDGAISRRIDLTQREADGSFSMVMLDRILPHELCHMMIRELFSEADCPLVVNEGLAMLSEYTIDNERIVLAGTALAGKGKIPLDRLLATQWQEMDSPGIFYAEAFSLLEFVYTRLSRRQQAEFLDHMRTGSTFVEALERALAVPSDRAFTRRLATAWEDHTIAQAQFLRALDSGLLADRPSK